MPRPEEKVKLPILATGISIRKRVFQPSNFQSGNFQSGNGSASVWQRGFTLWELLIVVAIVAITLSMMQFSMGLGDENRELKRVGKDLGKLFHLLNQEAVFESRNYAISVQENGFIVLEFDGATWTAANDSFYARIKMAESQVSELLIEDLLVDISSKEQPDPHILILSSGEMTPFEWRIQDQYSQFTIVLQGNLLGGVLMTGPEPPG
jgi:general secretion pathway protein H